MTLYRIFIELHLEWILYVGLLAGALHTFFYEPGKKVGRPVYILLNLITTAPFLLIVDRLPYHPLFESQGSAIWIFFVMLLFISFLYNVIFFFSRLLEGMVYTLFYTVFILTFKGILTPLYAAAPRLSPTVYALLDMGTILLLLALLSGFCYLFYHYRLRLTLLRTPSGYILFLLVPLLLFIVFLMSVTGNRFFQEHLQMLLCLVVTFALPLLYYLLASALSSYREKQELSQALNETRAQLFRYRYSLELEDRIRKERHELKNNYLHIQILLKENRLSDLDDYLSRVIGTRMEAISAVFTGDALIDYIINRKKEEAAKLSIPLFTDIVLDGVPAVNDDVFCTILLNLLDNAIEAEQQEEEPEIRLSLRNSSGYLVLCVKNRVSRDVLRLNPDLKTTKGDTKSHGHGVAIVRSSVKEQNGILSFSVEDGFFTATAGLPLKNI